MSVHTATGAAIIAAALLVSTPVHAIQDTAVDTAPLMALKAELARLSDAGVRPGYALVVAQDGDIVFSAEAGQSDLEAGTPFTLDTPVRIASMSKPVTSLATLMLVESGQIGLDDLVSTYIPAFADVRVATSLEADAAGEFTTRPPARPMTIHDLLTHTSGLGYLFDTDTDLGRHYLAHSLYEGEGDLAARIDRLAELPLYFDPGERWAYSYATDVLGRVVEVASGEALEDFLETRIFEPLEMHSTGFFYEDTDIDPESMSPLYVHDESGTLVRHDQPDPDWASGGGGLVSTARDYIRFASLLAQGGVWGETRLVEPETFALMATPQVTSEQLGERWAGASFGYGVDIILPPADGAEPRGIPGDISWGGYFDTDFFASPATGFAAVLLTQVQPGPHRPAPSSAALLRPASYQALNTRP
ncbi:serine hydrolase domain-containing protein [Maricaulis sp. CAU 1757]